MTHAWTPSGGPPVIGRPGSGLVTLLEETSFCISEASGDIQPGGAQGLFFRDTRFVSRLELRLDGEPPEPVAVQQSDPFACTFLGRRPAGPCQADSTLLVIRQRYVGNGMREDVTLRNLGREAAAAHLSVAVDGDFADLFEVKEGRRRRSGDEDDVDARTQNGTLWLRCRRGANVGGVSVTGTGDPSATPRLLAWQAVVPSGGSWTTSVQITPSLDGQEAPERYSRDEGIERSVPARRLSDWRRRSPLLHTSDERLAATFATSTEDLGSLRIFGRGHTEQDEHAVIAAGAPWFMTLFGRDSLLTSWMMLPLDRRLALGTLRTLASLQGEQVDPLTEEEPGRILHEIRGRAGDASLSLGGGSVYYGTVDATPLFVMLLGELARWGARRTPWTRCCPHADGALDWIDTYGDRDGDGFVEYQRATDRGLVNQGWKDSFDGINVADGRIAEPPIALAEVQAYVYAAYWPAPSWPTRSATGRRGPALAAKAGEALRRAFNERVLAARRRASTRSRWTAQAAIDAVDLERGPLPVDAGSWTEDTAAAVAGTGSSRGDVHRVRDPHAGHHDGRLQPDELPQRLGLAARHRDRRGRADALRIPAQAQRVAVGILDAAQPSASRLPELFCGFDRARVRRAGALPDLVLAAGLGRRRAAAAAAHPARARPGRCRRAGCGAPPRCPPGCCRCASTGCTSRTAWPRWRSRGAAGESRACRAAWS